MASLSFQSLWQNYPHAHAVTDAGTGASATRLARALAMCGIATPFDRRNLGEGAAGSVQALARWLSPGCFPGCPGAQSCPGDEALDRLQGRSGIVLIESRWQPPGATALRSEGHLDLWNGSQMTIGTSWLRTHLGITWEGTWTGRRGVERVRFWELA